MVEVDATGNKDAAAWFKVGKLVETVDVASSSLYTGFSWNRLKSTEVDADKELLFRIGELVGRDKDDVAALYVGSCWLIWDPIEAFIDLKSIPEKIIIQIILHKNKLKLKHDLNYKKKNKI